MENDGVKFCICNNCKAIVGVIEEGDCGIECCKKEMTELVPNTVEASQEKHLPVVEIKDNIVTVTVGQNLHPMEDEHKIQWIYLRTDQGGQRKNLINQKEPVVKFALTKEDKPVSVYAYCNLHGLWKTNI